MRKEKHYDEEYCIRLIQSALLPRRKNEKINGCKVKRQIIAKVETLQEQYGVELEDLFSEISRHFLEKGIYHKIDCEKAGPTTFILHYVLNQLRNIEKSCVRGTFEKAQKNCDAMDLVAFHLEDVQEDRIWIKELADYNDPESLLIAKEAEAALLAELTAHERSLLMGDITVQEYCKLTGYSSRTAYRRLASMRHSVEKLFVADCC